MDKPPTPSVADSAAAPPEEQSGRPPFYAAALERLQAAALEVLAAHPEIRSVAAVLDCRGGLNDSASLPRFLWTDEHGQVPLRAEAIFGSLHNVSQLLLLMASQAHRLQEQMRRELLELGQQIIERRKTLERLQSPAGQPAGQPADVRPDAGDPAGPDATAGDPG